ncbi:hypothetical protein [uncultured Psychrobacter sp.]
MAYTTNSASNRFCEVSSWRVGKGAFKSQVATSKSQVAIALVQI